MKKVTCYGTGVIGTAWAVVFLKAGLNVTLFDIKEEFLGKAKENLKGIFAFFKSQNLMTQDQIDDCMSRASFTTDPKTALEGTTFVQESCPEKLELKQSVLETIEEFAPADAIICSSTSGLPISKVAANAKHKERIVGGHPYNPVYMIPLVEITKGDYASDECVEKAKAFYLEVGKEPIVLNMDCPGFVCNRLQVALCREAYDLAYRGVCSVEDVDKAVVYSIGLRWAILGPHFVNELGGGEGGIGGLLTHIGPATKAWYEDMATWTEVPQDYIPMAVQGVADAMKNRKPGTGQNRGELLQYMNKGIFEILKYHGKL